MLLGIGWGLKGRSSIEQSEPQLQAGSDPWEPAWQYEAELLDSKGGLLVRTKTAPTAFEAGRAMFVLNNS